MKIIFKVKKIYFNKTSRAVQKVLVIIALISVTSNFANALDESKYQLEFRRAVEKIRESHNLDQAILSKAKIVKDLNTSIRLNLYLDSADNDSKSQGMTVSKWDQWNELTMYLDAIEKVSGSASCASAKSSISSLGSMDLDANNHLSSVAEKALALLNEVCLDQQK